MNAGSLRRLLLGVVIAILGLSWVSASVEAATTPPAAPSSSNNGTFTCTLSPLCSVTNGIHLPGIVTNPVGTVAGGAVSDLVNGITEKVSESARKALDSITDVINTTTAPDLTAAWFQQHYAVMISIMVPVALLMLVIAAIKAAMAGNAALAGKAVAYLPIAFIGTFAAVAVVTKLLQITDELSGLVAASLHTDFAAFAGGVGGTLSTGDKFSGGVFALLIGGVLTLIAAFGVFVILLLREGLIYATVLFIPLVLATMILPGLERIAKKLIDLLVAVILSKFVIVAVLALAAAGLRADAADHGLKSLLVGVAALGAALWLPWKLFAGIALVRQTSFWALGGGAGAAALPAPSSSGRLYASVRRNHPGGGPGGAGAVPASVDPRPSGGGPGGAGPLTAGRRGLAGGSSRAARAAGVEARWLDGGAARVGAGAGLIGTATVRTGGGAAAGATGAIPLATAPTTAVPALAVGNAPLGSVGGAAVPASPVAVAAPSVGPSILGGGSLSPAAPAIGGGTVVAPPTSASVPWMGTLAPGGGGPAVGSGPAAVPGRGRRPLPVTPTVPAAPAPAVPAARRPVRSSAVRPRPRPAGFQGGSS